MVLDAFDRKRPLVQREFIAAAGRRVQVSMDFVQEKGTQIGALLIMRDAESVRRIGDEIEMSRRLSASGRVTGGVAHEVKNPINASCCTCSCCKTSFRSWIPIPAVIWISSAARSSGSIESCRPWSISCAPANLHLEEVDLRALLEDVALLAHSRRGSSRRNRRARYGRAAASDQGRS